MIAYSELHPVSPGLERMLATVAHMVSVSGGIKVNEDPLELSDFLVRKYPNDP